MAKTMKKLDSKLQKQQQGWPKISNTPRKYYKDERFFQVYVIIIFHVYIINK